MTQARPASDASIHADATRLHAAVSALVRIYQFRDRDRICCHDVSVTQCYALEVLIEDGPLRSQELAATLKLDKSTTTRVVDALVRKGYAERTPHLQDRRAVSLRATARGRRLYERINGDLIAQQSDLLRDLDPDVRAGATELIQRLARAAEARFTAGTSVGECGASACPTLPCG